MTTVFVDVDGVVCNIHTPWIESYNYMYDDNLTPEKITDWGIEKFVKKECGDKIFNFIKDPQIYDRSDPIEGSLEAINLMKTLKIRVVYATTAIHGTEWYKFRWLVQHGFVEDKKDYIELADKSLLLGDYLIDDNYDNAKNFMGVGILFNQPWNKKYRFLKRADDWKQVLQQMNLVK